MESSLDLVEGWGAGYGSPGLRYLWLLLVALFFSPGGKGLLSCRYMRKFVKIRLGLHGIPSVHRLIPEVASSYTKTFPLTISWLRSRSCGRRKQWARAPVKHASKMISASLVVSICPRHVGTHAGAFPTFIAISAKRQRT